MQVFSYLSTALARVHPGWESVLSSPDIQQQLTVIDSALQTQKMEGKIVFPPADLTFEALTFSSPEDVRVVILGQDPYHGDGEAMGLSFSVPSGVRIPPSLRNIYKELSVDLACAVSNCGDLTLWAQQGVLLLNSVLTVQRGKAGSHARIGWKVVSDALINAVNLRSPGCAFLLWGNLASVQVNRVDRARHLVLYASHPSPLSAHRSFHGCRHFSQVNAWFMSRGCATVDWCKPALVASESYSNVPTVDDSK